jgi:hypothetical protein
MPLSTTATDPLVLSLVDIDTHIVITRLREKLQSKRLHLALRAPDVVHLKTCADRRACSDAWDYTWLNHVGRKVLHPDIFRPSWLDIKSCAENLEVPTMHQPCFQKVSAAVRDISIWEFEDELIQMAVDLLMVPEIEVALPLISELMDM